MKVQFVSNATDKYGLSIIKNGYSLYAPLKKNSTELEILQTNIWK